MPHTPDDFLQNLDDPGDASRFIDSATTAVTGGITAIIEELLRVSAGETGVCVLYDEDPVKLIGRLIHYYRTQHYRKPSCFCDAMAEG